MNFSSSFGIVFSFIYLSFTIINIFSRLIFITSSNFSILQMILIIDKIIPFFILMLFLGLLLSMTSSDVIYVK